MTKALGGLGSLVSGKACPAVRWRWIPLSTHPTPWSHLASPGTPAEYCSPSLSSPRPRPAPPTTPHCPWENQTGRLGTSRASCGQGEALTSKRLSSGSREPLVGQQDPELAVKGCLERSRATRQRANLRPKEGKGSYQALWWKTRAGSLRNRLPNCCLFPSASAGAPSSREAAITPEPEMPTFP